MGRKAAPPAAARAARLARRSEVEVYADLKARVVSLVRGGYDACRSTNFWRRRQAIIIGIKRMRDDAIIELDVRAAALVFAHLKCRRRLHADVQAARIA